MAARAIWKAEIGLGKTKVPVKMYSAVSDRTVHFRLLDPETLTPVKQRMVDTDSGREVSTEAVEKGYEVQPGLLVKLEEAELESLEPKPSRDIEIVAFVPDAEIDHRWYDRPYYLGPDGDQDAYFALAEALGKEGREGLARWTMRGKRYVGALRTEGPYLVLITLRHVEEVVDASALPRPTTAAPTKAEAKMAEQLVEMLRGPFQPAKYRDEYRDRVLELIEAKAKGRVVPIRKARKKKATDDSLEDLLEKSLKSRRKSA
ncbi:MAG TPA: Ku protein [Longimicrobiales bacterium]